MRIAVVGTGIAGLGAAHLLGRRHEVVVYERDKRVGGHAHTHEINTGRGPVAVDTGFIVYNERNYPLLTELFAELDVPTIASTMSFGVSVDRGRLEYSGQSPRALAAQPRNLARPGFLRMLADIPRFNRAARAYLRSDADDRTLACFLDELRVGDGFRRWYLLPMAAAIWSAPLATVMGFSARCFLRFYANHGLLQLTGQPLWRTVAGGSRVYVDKLVQRTRARFRVGTGAALVRSEPGGQVEIVDTAGQRDRFDRVVLACHADQALAMLDRPASAIAALLRRFPYQPNRALLHSDPRLMPMRRAAWSSWNYLADHRTEETSRVSVTYWMNRLQSLPMSQPLFVTLNPLDEPDPASVHAEMVYDHPLFGSDTPQAQAALQALQGTDGIYFAGAWTGYGFHEDGLRSAHVVAGLIDRAAVRPVAEPAGAALGGLPELAAASPDR